MQIKKIIEQVKTIKPSQYSDDMLLSWLSELDGQVYNDLLSAYGAPAPALPYGRAAMHEELLIPFPYEGIYLTWLSAKIDGLNCEYERYNNDMMLYNAQLQEFYNAYTRTHLVEKPVIVKGVKAL